MSKYVKNIISEELKKRLDGVESALLINMVGMQVNSSNKLRNLLAENNIQVLVVKNSLAAMATKGSNLYPLFVDANDKTIAGSCAVCWGASDIVALAKIIIKVSKDKEFAKMEIRGGVMDGEAFPAAQVLDVSKWPSREEQIAILLGQILGVGAGLASQLLSGGSNISGQLKTIYEKAEESDSPEVEEAPVAE